VKISIIPVSAVMIYLTGQRKSHIIQKSSVILKLRISGDSVHHQIAKFYQSKSSSNLEQDEESL